MLAPSKACYEAEAPLTYKNSPMSVVRFGLEMVWPLEN